MSVSASEVLAQLLDEAGFSQNGRYAPGLLDHQAVMSSATAALRYARLLTDHVDGEIGSTIDLVYEVPSHQPDLPGSPAIYFKTLRQPKPEQIMELRRRIWNQGRAPTLWIVTPEAVRIYDGFARPEEGETDKAHLIRELKRINGRFQHIADFRRREFDTGAFWSSKYGKKIRRGERVDQAMLADLTRTERLLTSGEPTTDLVPLSSKVAHALLGRAIFVRYLVDREILDRNFFPDAYSYNSFSDLLTDRSATFSFFDWLGETFNGDLFPLTSEERAIVEQPHLNLVRDFLSGADLSYYPDIVRPRLWPYDFQVIPVDLISSIYEMFAHSHDPKTAEALSIHYTRLPLVELLLSLAMRGLDDRARVLDPACGSGVFLVEAFRRLAWLRSRRLDRDLRRDELHELLRNQIFGLDVDPGAVQVAAFSLYLTLLELDPDPQPPSALRFPPLLASNAATGQGPNLYVQDFCNTEHAFNRAEPFAHKGFDLMVGNPPWTALKPASAPRDPDNPLSGRQWSLEYCKRHNVPDSKPDLAFILRSRDFANPATKIALVVCSRLLYQEADKRPDKRWLDTFLQFYSVDIFVNFTDFVGEKVLFGGRSSTRLPASALCFRAVRPTEDQEVMYITPKWYPAVRQRAEITITPSDVHHIPQSVLSNYPFLWKSALRGTPRDFRLLVKLQDQAAEYPTLKAALRQAGIVGPEQVSYGLTFGRNPTKDASALIGTPFLDSGISTRYGVDVESLLPFDRPRIAQRSNSRALALPVLILFRSLQDYRARAALVESSADRSRLVTDHMYYGISCAKLPRLGYRLNALLNSKLVFYMLFMHSSALGWDRQLVEPVDWLQVRLPASVLNPDVDETETWQAVLGWERELRRLWQGRNALSIPSKQIMASQQALDQAVYRLYGLSEQEITLVEDTVRYSIDGFLLRHKLGSVTGSLGAFALPDDGTLYEYASRMCKQLNAILRYADVELVPTIARFGEASPLRACRFTQTPQRPGRVDIPLNVVRLDQVDDIVEELSQGLRAQVADNLYVQRDLRVYDRDTFWIIKLAEKRLWTETAALNDADMVLCEHMEAQADG